MKILVAVLAIVLALSGCAGKNVPPPADRGQQSPGASE